jgi:hypothetical protein
MKIQETQIALPYTPSSNVVGGVTNSSDAFVFGLKGLRLQAKPPLFSTISPRGIP